MYPIKDYFLIGDLHTAALVSSKGSIDWMCLPHFDSGSIFARLLDRKAGTFAVDAMDFEASGRYIRDTAIVETIFKKKEQEFLVRDFMPPQAFDESKTHFLVRKLKGVKGEVEVNFLFDPKPEYALNDVVMEKNNDTLRGVLDHHILLLHLPKKSEVHEEESGHLIKIPLKKGEEKTLIMEYTRNGKSFYNNQDLEKETTKFWLEWVGKGRFLDFCKEELKRSAITLKLMQFYPTGGIIASPTTSLPETVGGVRNWDYRYVWIRDATFTLYALYVLGYTEEAQKFFHFIDSIIIEKKEEGFDLDLFYTIEGKAVSKEKILTNIGGYENSNPVRVGNDAREQFQLDVYGSIIDAYYFVSKRGVAISAEAKKIVLYAVEKIKSSWKTKDNGIWESRSAEQHYTYSKVMAWVGINRAIRLCEALEVDVKKKNELLELEKEIKDWIRNNCIDMDNKIIKQYPDTKSQDATNFLIVILQFFEYKDPIVNKIINNTISELGYKDLFVYRYLNNDDLEGKEGAFILCTFWYISALAIIGEADLAERLFYRFRGFISPSGLLSEEIDPETYEYLGNFPQAFSHVGYIMSAYYIQKYKAKNNE